MAATASLLRQMNQRALLRLLQRGQAASRAQLAKEAGLSAPTAGKIVDEMLSAGWIRALDEPGNATPQPAPQGPGRPGQMFTLDDRTCRFVAVQLGVVHTRLCGLALAAPETDRWQVQFKTPASPEAWLQQLRQAARALRQAPSDGVLLSVPGVVDEASQRVLFSPNAHWTEGVNLPALLKKVWDVPVAMVQEIRALALGQLAADPAGDDFFLVDIGAGIGGAAVIGGRLATSPLPLSGELGHTPVLGNTRRCGCGAVGCIETLVSRRGLLRSTPRDACHGAKPTWDLLRRHIEKKGLPPWLAHSLDAAAITIAGAINVLGVRWVVITGSLSELPPVVLDHLCSAVQRSAMWARFGDVSCIGAPRRRLAGLVTVGIERLLLAGAA